MSTEPAAVGRAAPRRRRSGNWLCGLLLAGLAACAAPTVRPPADDRPILLPFDYTPPQRSPARPVLLAAPAAPARLLPAAAAALERRGFEIERVDPGRGLLVVRLGGPPEPWVDCGTLRISRNGTVREVPAATASLRADRVTDGDWQLLRNLRLDARVVAAVRPGADGGVGVRATYVLTQVVDQIDAAGRVLGSARETVAFETGGVGTFRKGTRCVPTGALEEEVARAVAGAGS